MRRVAAALSPPRQCCCWRHRPLAVVLYVAGRWARIRVADGWPPMPETSTPPHRPIGWPGDDARSPVCTDRAAKVADNEPSAKGVDSAENAESPPRGGHRERWVEAVDGDRETAHLAAPGQIETPPRRTRRDSAAVDGSSPPAAYPVSLKSHRRLLAAECRRRTRRRTTREGSSTRMRSATYAQSKPRRLQATRSRRRRQVRNINAGDDLG